jgi:hypothetical protein
MVLDYNDSGTFGNVTIEPGVRNISANIFAEGKITVRSTGIVENDVPLTINGVTVAKQYDLRRLYPGSPTQAAEKFVYDGRIIANTPPGMSDIVKSLPIVGD